MVSANFQKSLEILKVSIWQKKWSSKNLWLWLFWYFMVFDFSQNFSGVVKRVQSSGAQIENHSVFKTRRVTWNTQQQITFYRLKKPRKSGFMGSKISVSYLRHNLKAFCHRIEIWKICFNNYLPGFNKDLMWLILIFDSCPSVIIITIFYVCG